MASALSAPDTQPPIAVARPRGGLRKTRSRLAQTPRLSIIIVNYRLWEETGKLVRELCISPCTRQGDVEVVVIDNHSPVHPLARRLRRWPGVSLRRWGRNRGFAQGVNEGSRLCRGDWLLLLNPDISVPEDFLEQLLNLANRLERDEPRAVHGRLRVWC